MVFRSTEADKLARHHDRIEDGLAVLGARKWHSRPMNLTANSSITFLKVADLERSHRFYSEILDLRMVLDQGSCRIYRLAGDAFIGVCQRDVSGDTNVIVTFVTDDVDAWHQRMVDAGVSVDGDPRDNAEYRIYQFFATDPDGHTIEVQRFWDSDWANAL